MGVQHDARRSAMAASALVIGIVSVLNGTPAARADDRDDDFLLALRQHGIAPLDDDSAGRAGLVAMGHWGCDQLSSGASAQNVVTWMAGYNQAHNLDFGATDAVVLSEAARFFCPTYQDAVDVIARRGRPH